jgi:hypothetical protein
MKDICKVGLTSRTIKERLDELYNTSVGSCFTLEYYIIVNPDERFKIEKNIHNDIVNNGYDRMPGREFFKCNPSDIIKLFEKYGEVKYEEVNENVMVGGKKKKIEGVKPVDKEDIIKLIKPVEKVIIEEINIKISKFQCKICNKFFARKANLENHSMKLFQCKPNKIIIKDIPNDKQCIYCKTIFSEKYNLTKHLNGHCKIKKEEDIKNNNNKLLLEKFLIMLNNQK